METKPLNFSKNLRLLRKTKNMKQEDLAKMLGVDQRTISAWENEICEPSLSVLIKLSEIFNESIEDILL